MTHHTSSVTPLHVSSQATVLNSQNLCFSDNSDIRDTDTFACGVVVELCLDRRSTYLYSCIASGESRKMPLSGNVNTFGAGCKRATWMNLIPLSHLIFKIAAVTAFLLTTAQGFSFTSFSHKSLRSTSLQVQPISAEKNEGLTHDPLPLDGVAGDTETEWNAFSSFGATLLQLRKEEEEIMLEIGGNVSNDVESELGKKPIKQEIPFVAREALTMNVGAASDLDNSVERITVQEFKDDMTVLPMTLSQASTASLPETAVSDMPLSRPEHYSDRLDRDKRLLAIGITESVDEPWQWQRFCEEKGGIKSLLKTIQNGANFAQHEQLGAEFLVLMEEYEETFLAACNACRALRDLCSISDDVRAVITDEIIRANAASGNNSLMNDFSLLLRHADEAEVLYNIRPQKFRSTSNPFRLMGRKDRRGECDTKWIRPIVRIEIVCWRVFV